MVATTETHIPFQEFTLSSSPTQDDSTLHGYSPPCLSCPSPPTSEDTFFVHTETSAPAARPTPSQEDFVKQLFGATSRAHMVSHLIATALVIARNEEKQSCARAWDAFAHEDTLFLRPTTAEVWTEAEFRDSVIALLEHAEENTDCDKVVIALEKERSDLDLLFKAFVCVGFEIVAPKVYNHDHRFLLVGYQV